MPSTITVQLSRNGKYAIITDASGAVYPCTDPEEAFDVLMELAARQNEPSTPYVEAEYVEDDEEYAGARYVDAEDYDPDGTMAPYDDEQWRQENEQTIHFDGEPLSEAERSRLDFGDPVTNAAAEMAVQGGVSLFQTLQGLSYRGKRQKRRAAREAQQAELEELRRLHRRRRR